MRKHPAAPTATPSFSDQISESHRGAPLIFESRGFQTSFSSFNTSLGGHIVSVNASDDSLAVSMDVSHFNADDLKLSLYLSLQSVILKTTEIETHVIIVAAKIHRRTTLLPLQKADFQGQILNELPRLKFDPFFLPTLSRGSTVGSEATAGRNR